MQAQPLHEEQRFNDIITMIWDGETPATGDELLLTAILARAILDATGNVTAIEKHKVKNAILRARDWISGEIDDPLGISFEGCCDLLDLDPGVMRGYISRAIAEDRRLALRQTRPLGYVGSRR